MAQKTIPQLNEITSIDENAIIPVDSGIQSYKISAPNLAASLNEFLTNGGKWKSTKTYAIGDIAYYEGKFWRAITSASNKNPITFEGSDWVLDECEEKFDWAKFSAYPESYFTGLAGGTYSQGSVRFGMTELTFNVGSLPLFTTPFIRYSGLIGLSGSFKAGGSTNSNLTIEIQIFNKEKIQLGGTTVIFNAGTGNHSAGKPITITPQTAYAEVDAPAYYKLRIGANTISTTVSITSLASEVIDGILQRTELLQTTLGGTTGGTVSAIDDKGIYNARINGSSFYWSKSGSSSNLTNPTLPTTNGNEDLLWSTNGTHLAMSLNASPWLALFSRSGDTLTRVTLSGAGLSSQPRIVGFGRSVDGGLPIVTENMRLLVTTGATTYQVTTSGVVTASSHAGLIIDNKPKFVITEDSVDATVVRISSPFYPDYYINKISGVLYNGQVISWNGRSFVCKNNVSNSLPAWAGSRSLWFLWDGFNYRTGGPFTSYTVPTGYREGTAYAITPSTTDVYTLKTVYEGWAK